MATWQNDDFILYHGSTEDSLRPLDPEGLSVGVLPHHINLERCGTRTEFGRGFYVTSSLEQAKSWANLQAKRIAIRKRKTTHPRAVVLGVSLNRDRLATLEALVFTNENCGFWPFVEYCRAGHPPHGRRNAVQVRYDIVYGPLSIWPQHFVLKDCDQVSFHSAKALSIIPALDLMTKGDPLFA
jgi:hypothetical protein